MFRITRLLQLSKPLITTSSSFFRPSALVFKSLMCFSQNTKNKIFELIEHGKVEQNLDSIMIDIAYMNNELRQQVLRKIVQSITIGLLPPTILTNQKFEIQLKKHPVLYFEGLFFLAVQSINEFTKYIGGNDKKIKKSMNKQISDYFVTCFETLKKIQPKEVAAKQIQLLRTFAHYNYFYSTRLVDPSLQQECVKKSRQNYKLTLNKSTALFKSLLKEQESTMAEVKPKQKPEQRQKRLNELKQEFDELKFDVAERYGEIVFQILNIEDQQFQKNKLEKQHLKELQSKKKKEKDIKKQQEQEMQFQMGKQTLALQPFISQAIKNFELIPHRMVESKCYYKLRKMHLEVLNQMKIRQFVLSSLGKKKNEKEKQLLKIELQIKATMDNLYDEALKKLQETKSQELDAQILSEHVMVMLSTKIQQFFVDEGEETTMNAKDIAKQVEKLVNVIVDQTKRKKTLAFLIHKVKATFDVKIDSYVEKVPRNMRTQRRKKIQQF